MVADSSAGFGWPPVLVRGGLFGSLLCSVPVAAWGLLAVGREALIGWCLAMIIVSGYFVGSAVGDTLATRQMNQRGLVMGLAGFVFRAGLVALLLWQLVAHGLLTPGVRGDWFAWTTLALVIGWTGGIVLVHSRTRSLIYDEPAPGATEVSR